jgi:exosortase
MMRRPYLYFSLLFVVSLVVWNSSIAGTFRLAVSNEHYTHLLIIFPISAVLLYLDRKRLIQATTPNAYILSSFFFVASLIIFIVAKRVPAEAQLTVSMLGVVIWWIAAFIFSFGLNTFRVFLFPVLFLFWLVPLPQLFLDELIGLLQQYSASAASWMFDMVGIPVLRQGVIISIPTLTIEVAKECSSIRSSLILLVSSMVLAQLFLRSKRYKALVIFIAVPLSVAKNALRIFTLSMLGIHVNRGFLTGRLHHEGGGVFYAAALAAIFAFIYLLQRREANVPPGRSTTPVAS